jgi:hypothetical protein
VVVRKSAPVLLGLFARVKRADNDFRTGDHPIETHIGVFAPENPKPVAWHIRSLQGMVYRGHAAFNPRVAGVVMALASNATEHRYRCQE